MEYTKKQFLAIVEDYVPDEPTGRCFQCVDELNAELNRFGFSNCKVQEGRFIGWRVGGKGETPHWFIAMDSENLRFCNKSIYVDPTVEQFKRNTNSNTQVPQNIIPEDYIVRKTDRIYDAYDRDES